MITSGFRLTWSLTASCVTASTAQGSVSYLHSHLVIISMGLPWVLNSYKGGVILITC